MYRLLFYAILFSWKSDWLVSPQNVHKITFTDDYLVSNYFIRYILRFLALLITCGALKGSLCLIVDLTLANEYHFADTLLLHPNPSNFKVKNYSSDQISLHGTVCRVVTCSFTRENSIIKSQ